MLNNHTQVISILHYLNSYTVADKKSSRFRCVQRRFVSVPLAFRFRFPLRFVAESVPYKVNGGQTVKINTLA